MKTQYDLYSAYNGNTGSSVKRLVKGKWSHEYEWLHIYGNALYPFNNSIAEVDLGYTDSDNPFIHSSRFSYRLKVKLPIYQKMGLRSMLILGKRRNAKCFY